RSGASAAALWAGPSEGASRVTKFQEPVAVARPCAILFQQHALGRNGSMRGVKLDRIDRRILRDLQDSGRMTNAELAERAEISAPPCLRRVRALEEAGLIRG